MRQVTLDGTGLAVSRFIFGTASLFNVGSAKERAALLDAAVDAGFTHFDTAPYYGFGMAERDMAAMLRAHPHVTFTTKVGIYSPGGEEQAAWAIFARKAAGRAIRAISKPTVDFSLARARHALEGSLRRTGRGHIDLYTLHEPEAHLLDYEEWRRWLEDMVGAGAIGSWGVALTADRLQGFFDRGQSDMPVIQMLDSIAGREADMLADNGRAMQITYGYVSAALARDPAADVPGVIAAAMQRNRDGALIVSTGKIARLAQYARLGEG
ncbi:MAG: aldo/keto reductase [Sphingomonadales bacterium]|nr:aldo/keto reductase [Sphingomonadales bacterium]MBD3775198.1 aldo/keto reductase [Paracoccaceae bacterium]